MGRSATLCRAKGGLVAPLDWNAIRDSRDHVNKNLMAYLKGASCVQGAPVKVPREGSYLDELSRAFVSILIAELNNLDNPEKYESSVSFAVIYTEMWRQATLIGTQLPPNDDTVSWIKQPTGEVKELVSVEQLRKLNAKWKDWSCSKLESDYFLSFAVNLSDGYLKAMEEARIAAESGNEASGAHHVAVLGDIFHEMLTLHETLMPRKNSRFSQVIE
ncbi:hypothetical protein GPA27_20145 [Aromatoleum toluolicum]|uniref:Uncharacterized protein n=1 Tax=Aromatoleum toluolicum TaxID=90060 RepID=A0ABX1NK24_9RHOO|nr:hypothetical protein [Aromatoleum toluolicum]NMF99693.1 hypothetical protein [Aromatoleum toluolicum]